MTTIVAESAKACSRCGVVKPLTSFNRNAKSAGGYLRDCKDCRKEVRSLPANRARDRDSLNRWRANNKERASLLYWRAKLKGYGLTVEEYYAILREQNGCCAICGGNNPKQHRLAVDHDHVTGRVRGLLCHSCNSGMGKLRDSPDLLRAAILYLERSA